MYPSQQYFMKGKLPKLLQKLMFIRILGLIFALLLCIKLLAACHHEPVKLSFVVPPSEVKYWKPMLTQFNNQNNNNIYIKLANENGVNPQDDTGSVKKIYIDSFERAQPYDLIYMDIIWLPQFAANDKTWLMDLSKYFKRNDLEKDFLKSEVANGYYNEKLYRIPFRTDIGLLYYRKDLLKSLGNPKLETFNDLINISQKLQKQNSEWRFLWQGRQSEALVATFVDVLEGFGGFWVNDTTKEVGLNQPKAIQAVKFLRDTIDKGISEPSVTSDDENETRNKFLRGEAVFMRNWPSVWVYANRPGSDILGKIDIKPMVRVEGQSRGGGCKGGWGFGIAKNTKHPQQAIQAIKFLTSAVFQRQFTLTYGSVPSRRRLFFEPKIVAKYSHYPKLLDMLDGSDTRIKWVPRPRIPQYEQASCILQKNLHAALSTNNGRPSPEEAMTKAADETKQLLSTGNFNCK